MKSKGRWMGLLLLMLLAGQVRAEPGGSIYRGCWWPFRGLPDARQLMRCWCPDDYRAKQLPVAPCKTNGCLSDDYCSKKPPCDPCRPGRGCADDYLPKGCPIQFGIVVGPHATCGPAGGGCSKSR